MPEYSGFKHAIILLTKNIYIKQKPKQIESCDSHASYTKLLNKPLHSWNKMSVSVLPLILATSSV